MPEPKQASSAPASSKDETTDVKVDVASTALAPVRPVAEIKANAQLIERAVSTLEPRFTHRVLRSLTTLRRKINASILKDALEIIYPKGAPWCVLHHQKFTGHAFSLSWVGDTYGVHPTNNQVWGWCYGSG